MTDGRVAPNLFGDELNIAYRSGHILETLGGRSGEVCMEIKQLPSIFRTDLEVRSYLK